MKTKNLEFSIGICCFLSLWETRVMNKQQNIEEKESKLTDPEEENDASSVEHVDTVTKDQSLGAKLKGWKMDCYSKLTI